MRGSKLLKGGRKKVAEGEKCEENVENPLSGKNLIPEKGRRGLKKMELTIYKHFWVQVKQELKRASIIPKSEDKVKTITGFLFIS